MIPRQLRLLSLTALFTLPWLGACGDNQSTESNSEDAGGSGGAEGGVSGRTQSGGRTGSGKAGSAEAGTAGDTGEAGTTANAGNAGRAGSGAESGSGEAGASAGTGGSGTGGSGAESGSGEAGTSTGTGGAGTGGSGAESGSGEAGTSTATGGTATGGSSGAPADDVWVVGSHPDYQWDEVGPTQVPYEHLTHLFLSFLEPAGSNGSYTMEVTGYGAQDLPSWTTEARRYIEAAHAAGVKVLVDLGGESGADLTFIDACDSTANTTAMAGMITSTLRDIGFDGVDLDWEGDNYDGACAATLLQALRAEWSDGIITTAVGPVYGDDQINQMNALGAAEGAIDAVMLMSYIPPDQTWTWWVVPVPVTPLHGASTPWDTTEPQPYSVDRDRTVLTAAGFPASKLVMGIAGFGLVWGDTNDDGEAPVEPYANYDALADDPSCSGEPWTCDAAANTEVSPIGCSDNSITQLWLDEALAVAGSSLTLATDETGEVNYYAASSPTSLVSLPNPCGSGTIDAGLILYETPTSVGNKLAYVHTYGMRGVEFWTMAQTIDESGQYPLLEAARP